MAEPALPEPQFTKRMDRERRLEIFKEHTKRQVRGLGIQVGGCKIK
jgi:hypothetical protein